MLITTTTPLLHWTTARWSCGRKWIPWVGMYPAGKAIEFTAPPSPWVNRNRFIHRIWFVLVAHRAYLLIRSMKKLPTSGTPDT